MSTRGRRSPAAVALTGALAGGAAAAFGVLGYRALVGDHGESPLEAAAHVAVGWTFVVAGFLAWWRRPASRVGALLCMGGLALLVRRLQYSDDSLRFTVAFALGELSNALVAHAVLAYPSGRLRSRFERGFVAAGYAAVLAFPLATLLVYDRAVSCLWDCDDPSRARSLLLVSPEPGLVDALRDAFRVSVFGALGAIFLVLLVQRLRTAGPAGRRLQAPFVAAGIAAAVRVVSEGGLTFTTYSEGTRRALLWWQLASQAAIPLALLAGLLRSRLARAAFADLLPELERAPPTHLRDVLARALGDPTLAIGYWVPGRGWVDAAGAELALPERGSPRAVTPVEHDGRRIAALVHDPALSEEPLLPRDAAAAGHLALENARLQADLQAQLAETRESRARIAGAADAERRRIERDLHDGAQQRLLALALQLRSAERTHGTRDPELARVLDAAVGELQQAVEDLRELAHGLHPTLLAEEGLAAAVAALAARAPLPVEVSAALPERPPPAAEGAAYFVVAEALANVIRHAGASRVQIAVGLADGALTVEVGDDGAGGADPRGSGLRGLADRVEALGGRLRVGDAAAGGTRVEAVIPCGS